MPRKIKAAFQIDEIKEISINNCTLYMMQEAQERGVEIYHFTPEALTLDNGKVHARANELKVDLKAEKFITLGKEAYLPLSHFDVVFIRQDPVINTRFFANTFMLEKAKSDTWIINDPVALRNSVEKLEFFGFESLQPPTLISLDKKIIQEFREEHGDIILKPLSLYRGQGVFHLKKDDSNLNTIVESIFSLTNLPVIAQKYLPEIISIGDKRIVLIFGEIAGAMIRKPAPGQIRAVSDGCTIHKVELTADEITLAKEIGAALHQRGIEIAGVDFISKYLTEINVITPGFSSIRKLYNTYPEKLLWDRIEEKLK